MIDPNLDDQRQAIAKAIHDGPFAIRELTEMQMSVHAWEDCPHQKTYLGDADAVLAAGFRHVVDQPLGDWDRMLNRPATIYTPPEDRVARPSTEPKRTGSHLTTDPTDPRLGHGPDDKPTPQQDVYLVLSEEERAKGFVRPVRQSYVHDVCGGATRMGRALAETYAAKPTFYGATYCVHCTLHAPVAEFTWDGTTERVGS